MKIKDNVHIFSLYSSKSTFKVYIMRVNSPEVQFVKTCRLHFDFCY